MTFKVTILGSGAAQPVAGRHHSAQVVNLHEQFYLLDCGEGTQSRLARAGVSPLKLGAVFISHLHGDHVYGLFPLISTMGLLGRRTPLDVFGPRPLGEVLECHTKYFDTELPFPLRYHEVDARQHALIFENKVLEVWSVPLRHRVPASGFLFREKEPPLNIRKEAIARYGLGIAQCAALKRGEDLIVEEAANCSEGIPPGVRSEELSRHAQTGHRTPGIGRAEDASDGATAAPETGPRPTFSAGQDQEENGSCPSGDFGTQIIIPNAELTYRPYRPRGYAYLSDTLYSAKAAGLVRGVDLLYHEATFADADRALARQTGHSTTLQAAKAAVTARAKHLLIGHFSGRYKDEQTLVEEARSLFPATEAAAEGQTYGIDPEFSPRKE